MAFKRKSKTQEKEAFRPAPDEATNDTQEYEPSPEEQAEADSVGTEVATTQSAGGVAVVESVKVPSIMSLEDKWDPRMFGNTLPRVAGKTGSLKVSTGLDLGAFADVEVYSHNERYLVSPVLKQGDKDQAAARKYCRVSYDGEMIPGRDITPDMTIEEYAEDISDKYPDVKVAKYRDVYAVIFNSDKNKEAAMGLLTVKFGISQTAIDSFLGLVMQSGMAVKRGLLPASHQNCIRFYAEDPPSDFDYTVIKTAHVPQDILMTYTPCPDEE